MGVDPDSDPAAEQNDVDPLSLELSQDADTDVNLVVAKKVGGL